MTVVIPSAALAEVAPHFEDATFERGLVCAESGDVHLVKADPWPVVARVASLYVVTVRQNGQTLHGDCSCSVHLDCEHAAAAALVALTEHGRRRSGTSLAAEQQLVSDWLATLNPRNYRQPDGASRKLILYLLRRDSDGHIGLTVEQSFRKKRGGLGKSSSLITRQGGELPAWIPGEDLQRIALLRAVSPAHRSRYLFSGTALDGEQLRDLADTGRLYWESTGKPPLRYGPPREQELTWLPVNASRDRWRLGIEALIEILPARDCHYIDVGSRQIGPLDLGVAPALVAPLLSGPQVPSSMLSTARHSLAPLVEGSKAAAEVGSDQPPLRPHLHLGIEQAQGTELGYIPHAEARYGEERFVLGEWDPDRPLDRNLVVEASEHQALAELVDAIPRADSFEEGRSGLHKLRLLRDLAHRVGPILIDRGWTVDLGDDFPFELADRPTQIYEKLTPAVAERGWFKLELGVVVGDQTISLLPILLEALRREELTPDGIIRATERDDYTGINLELPTGQLVHIPGDRVEAWVRPLIELQLRGLDDDGELLIPSHTAVELDDDQAGRFGDSRHREQAREHLAGLIDLEPIDEGRSFDGELRCYQRRGLAWLSFLHGAGYGGILADDLGLGKTVQLLAFFDRLRATRKLRKRRPILVVAPRSVVGQWHGEASRFTPKLKAAIHLGPDRARTIEDLTDSQLIATSYQTMHRDIELLAQLDWSCAVFDEAQAIKNPDTQLRQAAARLRASSRFCVTGTPIENHLGELWSQMDLVMPGLLGTQTTFKAVIRRPIERHAATVPLGFLKKRIRPFILRRTKGSIDLDLPPKTEATLRVHLEDAQRDLYESLRLELDSKVRRALGKSGKASSLVVLEALLKLRQCCCDPRLLPLDSAGSLESSAKLERLMAMLDELADEGRAVLVFSQFTSMLDLIRTRCQAAGIDTLSLTGSTRNREKVIAAFQNGAAPVFLISLKAGGTGLNLTRADTVIHYDPWWNPAVEDQATDRTHRIGQDKPVFVYKLVAADTVEDRMLELQRDKRAIADAVYAGGDATSLARSDLTALFRELV
ncbi:MAG: DEAD/DEAH box helicase [Deltaproteobacteria bacterium]|nr:DEAD/DEAH box helicase [Deltaproteobacteria bacterium]